MRELALWFRTFDEHVLNLIDQACESAMRDMPPVRVRSTRLLLLGSGHGWPLSMIGRSPALWI